MGTPINITDPKGRYAIRLYDYDSADEDEFMGGIEFTPYSDHNEFPESELLDMGDIAFKVYYTYEW
jgi:hypothetical protein